MIVNNLNNDKSIIYSGIRRMHLRKFNDIAVSEYIGYLLVFLIASSAITVTLVWGTIEMQNSKTTVHLESATLQLDAMVDLIDEIYMEGAFDYSGVRDVNNSNEMNLQLSEGSVYLDDQGERIVFWYSIHDLGTKLSEIEKRLFSFDVSGFDPEDGDEHMFHFQLNKAPIDTGTEEEYSGGLIFRFTRLADGTSSKYESDFSIGVDYDVICEDFPLTGAIRINIYDKQYFTEYGRIWLFDLGSLTFETSLHSKKAIVENSGILQVIANYGNFYNEPRYWSWDSLDENMNMTTLRILQIRKNPFKGANSVGISGSGQINFLISSNSKSSGINQSRIFDDFRMRIYGDESVVSAWRSYFVNRMGFVYFNGVLTKPVLEPIIDNIELKYIFSLSYGTCYISMEVEG